MNELIKWGTGVAPSPVVVIVVLIDRVETSDKWGHINVFLFTIFKRIERFTCSEVNCVILNSGGGVNISIQLYR